jgi:hypothetical protein
MKEFTVLLRCLDAGDLVELTLAVATEVAASADQINVLPIYGDRVLAHDARLPGQPPAATIRRIS